MTAAEKIKIGELDWEDKGKIANTVHCEHTAGSVTY